jgi:hypothetical protein
VNNGNFGNARRLDLLKYLPKNTMSATLVFICIVSFLSAVAAYSNGAGFCYVGTGNNTNGQHLQAGRIPQTGSIDQGGYRITLNGNFLFARTMNNSNIRNNFTCDEQLSLRVSVFAGADNPAPFLKGVFIIASGGNPQNPDELDTRSPGALQPIYPITQESISCDNFLLASVVHVEPSEKQTVEAILYWPTSGQVLYLDVEIVQVLNATASKYYYSQYVMQSTKKRNCGFFGLRCVVSGYCNILSVGGLPKRQGVGLFLFNIICKKNQ